MLHLWMDIVLLSRHPASIHRPVHRFSETVYQPVPNPDGPVILVPSLGWIRTGMDPHEGEGGPLVCGFDPWKTQRPHTNMMEAAATGGGWRPWWRWFLEVESALAVEAAWELKEAVASMDGSLNMDADTSLDLHRVRRRWVDLHWQGLPSILLVSMASFFFHVCSLFVDCLQWWTLAQIESKIQFIGTHLFVDCSSSSCFAALVWDAKLELVHPPWGRHGQGGLWGRTSASSSIADLGLRGVPARGLLWGCGRAPYLQWAAASGLPPNPPGASFTRSVYKGG